MDRGAGVGAGTRRLSGGLRELWYRAIGRGPVPEAGDRVLAERIRSVLGPLERRLGVEAVEVTVEYQVAVLRGEVPDDEYGVLIVAAAAATPGVREVRSELRGERPAPTNGKLREDPAG